MELSHTQDSIPDPVLCLGSLTFKQPSAVHPGKQVLSKAALPGMSYVSLSSHPSNTKGSSIAAGHARPWDHESLSLNHFLHTAPD